MFDYQRVSFCRSDLVDRPSPDRDPFDAAIAASPLSGVVSISPKSRWFFPPDVHGRTGELGEPLRSFKNHWDNHWELRSPVKMWPFNAGFIADICPLARTWGEPQPFPGLVDSESKGHRVAAGLWVGEGAESRNEEILLPCCTKYIIYIYDYIQ